MHFKFRQQNETMADQQGEAQRGVVITERARPRQRRSRRIKLQSIATRNVPEDVQNDQEKIDIVSLLAETNLIDIEEDDLEFNFLTKTSYEVNEKGRIIHLMLGVQHLYAFWNLPNLIFRFNMLIDLTLCQCGRLPQQFELPNLHQLMLHSCDDQLLESYQATTAKFPNLANLVICRCNLGPSNISSWISFISVLTKLDYLQFDRTSDGCIDPILQILRDKSLKSDKLQALVISHISMSGIHLKRLLLELLPRFKNLRVLRFENNGIKSLQLTSNAINERLGIISPCMTSFFNNVVQISLEDNPVIENIKNDDKEKKALLSCLRYFKRVSAITINPFTSSRQFDNEIRHALQMAYAGKILLEGGGNKLSISVWPTVLKRAFDLSLLHNACQSQPFAERSFVFPNPSGKTDVSVVYDLLRNGPIIQAFSNNNNNNNSKRKQKQKRKRESPSSTGRSLSRSRRSRRLRHNEPY